MRGIVRGIAVLVVRTMVWLYPRGYRRRVGQEMVEAFRERIADRTERGVSSMLALAFRTVADMLGTAVLEWFSPADRQVRLHRALRRLARHRWAMLDAVRADLRFALRSLGRRPAFTAVAGLTLALGIGATTVFFSAVNAVLLRPLWLGDPDRLVAIWETDAIRGATHDPVAPANLFEWREHVGAFADVAGFGNGIVTIAAGELPEVVAAAFVTGNFFDVAGIRPALGRWFTDAETWDDASPVVMLSDALWARRFGRDPAVVGSTMVVDETVREVVGVMPSGFEFPDRVDVWVPLGWYRAAPGHSWFRREHFLRAVARLEDGATLERARAELDVVMSRLEAEHPVANAGIGAGATRLQDHLAGEARAPLLILLGAGALVLLLACANIANLLLARATDRTQEFAVRAALGASRARVVAQLGTESLVLALAGGLAGVTTAAASLRLIVLLRPPEALGMDRLTLDGRVLVFALAVTVVTGVLFGLAPALFGASSRAAGALESGVRVSAGRRARQANRALVVAEISLAVMLASSAGLLLRSFIALRQVDPGFRIDDRIAASIFLPQRYWSDAGMMTFIDTFMERVESLPGVEAATYATRLPFTGIGVPAGGLFWERADAQPVVVRGRELDGSTEIVGSRLVAADYFELLGVPLIRGRHFAETDGPNDERVVIINEQLARRFGNGDPLGQRITWDDAPSDSSTWYRVIGVVGDQRQNGLHAEPPPEAFMAFRQLPSPRVRLIVQGRIDAAALSNALRAELAAIDPHLAFDELVTLRALYAAQFGRERLLLALIGGFAVVALVLASVGVYGLMAGLVARRTREIGIRVALGAASGDIAAFVIRQGVLLTIAGLSIGTAAALVTSRLLDGILFGVEPTDPATFVAVAATLLLVAVIACTLPARRATTLDPTRALRHD